MDLIIAQLKPRVQLVLNIITSIIGALICLIIARYSVEMTLFFFQLDYIVQSMLKPLKWPIMTIIPVGSFLLFIQFLRRAFGYLRGWRAS